MDKEKKVSIGSEIEVKPLEAPQTNIDIDKSLEDAILQSAQSEDLQAGVFESFSTTAQTRESEYELIDTMAMDSTIAAAIQTYAEDIAQPNDDGRIVWVESSDSEVASYVDYLLKKMNVDKQVFSWAYNLTKYGDVYVRLLRDSDFSNSRLFGAKVKKKPSTLNEDVNLNITRDNDHYALTLEMVKNPNEMFELTKFGKSMGYIKAATNVQKDFTNKNDISYYTRYRLQKKDVDIYAPTEFAHACLEGSKSRTEEELDIFFSNEDYDSNLNAETFQVRRGTGILNDLFKVWRQLSLLENSVLLNRVTRSSIIRLLEMEVGDMTTNQVTNVTSRVKNLIENKSSLDVGKNYTEFTNPGPMENVIIMPTRGGKGHITVNQIGGEVDPKQLTDLDWFNNKLFGGLKIPKQYFGWTSDAGGFSAGTSLAQYSSRYGKAIKRMQIAITSMITDIINLILIDTGYPRYIGRFNIKMQAPITQEEIDRKSDVSNTLRNISDIMNILNDVNTTSARLTILKSLLAKGVSDQEITNVLDEEIKKLKEEEKKDQKPEDNEDNNDLDSLGGGSGGFNDFGSDQLEEFNPLSREPSGEGEEPIEEPVEQSETSTESEDNLPTFDELGVDGTVNL